MGLEWIVLATAVGIEAALVLAVSLPIPKSMVKNVIQLYKRVLQPLLAILPFALFQLLDVYWKYETRIVCTGENCSTMERDRYEKSLYKAERNGILSLLAIFLYWVMFRYTHYLNEQQHLEAQVASLKSE